MDVRVKALRQLPKSLAANDIEQQTINNSFHKQLRNIQLFFIHKRLCLRSDRPIKQPNFMINSASNPSTFEASASESASSDLKASRTHHTVTTGSATGDFGIDNDIGDLGRNATQSVNCVLYNRHSGQLVAKIELDEVQEQLAKHHEYFVWIYLFKPSNEVLATIQRDFELHDLAIEDTTMALQRTKIELYGDKLFVVFGTVSHNESLQGIELGSSNIFLGERFIISVRQGNTLCEHEVISLSENNARHVKHGPSYIFYALMNCMVEEYLPILEQMHERLEDLKANIFTDKFHRQTLHYLYGLKEELTRFHLAVAPTKEVVCYLIAHQSMELAKLVPKDIIPYFRDIQDKILTTLDIIQSQSEMQKAAMDTHLAQVSLSQNEIVKRLASWAAILAVPTLIASIYGMNFDLMPELHWPSSYFIVLLIMVSISSFLFYRFRQVNWL